MPEVSTEEKTQNREDIWSFSSREHFHSCFFIDFIVEFRKLTEVSIVFLPENLYSFFICFRVSDRVYRFQNLIQRRGILLECYQLLRTWNRCQSWNYELRITLCKINFLSFWGIILLHRCSFHDLAPLLDPKPIKFQK